MDSAQLEQRGRVLAHAYVEEMEKIALRLSATDLAKAPLEGLHALVNYNKHTVPEEIDRGFSLHHRVLSRVKGLRAMNEGAQAAHAMRADGEQGAKEALQAIEQRRSAAHRVIIADPSHPSAEAAHDTLKKLREHDPSAPGAKTTLEELRKALAGKGSVEAQRSSGTALKVAGGVGLLGATAAGGAYAYDKATKPPEYPQY